MPKKKINTIAPFLKDLLIARSPSGYEQEAHEVLERHVKPQADEYYSDSMGNRIAVIQPKAKTTLMFAGHMDELGLQVKYVDDAGYIYFNTLGGHDTTIISGRRVEILTKNGTVKGVTGKRAIHLMTPEQRKKAPEIHDIWIDIGATSQKEALEKCAIGDAVVYDHGLDQLSETVWASRAFDDKTGCYVVCEALNRLSKGKKKPSVKVAAVATAQEEVGCRGAIITAEALRPDFAVAVDVAHATDHPDCDPRKHGSTRLGGGPILYRGPNIHPWLFDQLVLCAEEAKIPYQVVAGSLPLGNDSRSIQIAGKGVATACVGIPLRYMHTPSELVDLVDLENCVELLRLLALHLDAKDSPNW